MKKGQIMEGYIEQIIFPNKGVAVAENGEHVTVKNTIPQQKVSFQINKVRKGKAEGRLLETIEKSPLEVEPSCPHFGDCGGCTYLSLPYEEQLKIKESQVRGMMEEAIQDKCEYEWLGIKGSPKQAEYRNKMEFSFGDAYKGGPLALGQHKRGSFYDILTVTECQIVDEDFRLILKATVDFFGERGLTFFHRLTHVGYLRHLLVRKAVKTQEILVDLVTTTQYDALIQAGAFEQDETAEIVDASLEEMSSEKDENRVSIKGVSEEELLQQWKEVLCALPLKGELKGVLRTKNDSLADVVRNDGTDILYGQDYFYEELLGLTFKISPFSFFQTNSLGAEVLYETAREFILSDNADELKGKIVYDLYSGTGTIAQLMAPVAKKVIGVEIVEEAVEAAKINAELNGLDNCTFWAGDVLKVIDELHEIPDLIMLDPPRDGVHPKALEKIIGFGVDKMVYISCKPTSLVRDLETFLECGYVVEKAVAVDQFPWTTGIETVCLLSKKQ